MKTVNGLENYILIQRQLCWNIWMMLYAGGRIVRIPADVAADHVEEPERAVAVVEVSCPSTSAAGFCSA